MSRQKAEEAYQAFVRFLTARDAAKDWPTWADRSGCFMSPQKVCDALGIGTSALRQNSRIKEARETKEKELRHQGIFLVPVADSSESPAGSVTALSASRDKSRIKQLEEKNAELREENGVLKAMLRQANMFEDHLLQTGRALPL